MVRNALVDCICSELLEKTCKGFFLFLNVTKSPLCRLVSFNVTFVLICEYTRAFTIILQPPPSPLTPPPLSPLPSPSPPPLSVSCSPKELNVRSCKLFLRGTRFWNARDKVLTITCPYHFIVRQRQMLRAVPVSEVFYEWKETSSRYWVFGLDHQVYAPDYPQKCCCGCSILWRWRDVRDILHLSRHLA